MLNMLFSSLGYWLLLVAVAMVALRIVVRLVRRNYQRGGVGNLDLDLADLQKLVAKGLMTEEEYFKAREVILSRSDARHEPAKGFPVLAPPQVRGFPVLPPPDQNKPPRTQ
jgi:hypothetical protein